MYVAVKERNIFASFSVLPKRNG